MTIKERTVLLYDAPCTVKIFHPSKTVWFAVGDYMGNRCRYQTEPGRMLI
jgi:hypothetical protein